MLSIAAVAVEVIPHELNRKVGLLQMIKKKGAIVGSLLSVGAVLVLHF